MSALTLVIGNKNYSSWSLRAWLVASHSGLNFHELPLQLQSADFKHQVARFSPAGRVPVLLVGKPPFGIRWPLRNIWPSWSPGCGPSPCWDAPKPEPSAPRCIPVFRPCGNRCR